MTGSRPMNSGISPKLRRSSGMTSESSSDDSTSCFERMSAPKPSAFFPIRRAMILSSPAKAPPQMKRMLVGSIERNSWCGCFRRPLARHVARDRRVVRLARDLVHLFDVDDPGLGLLDVEVRVLDQLEQEVLDVLADI